MVVLAHHSTLIAGVGLSIGNKRVIVAVALIERSMELRQGCWGLALANRWGGGVVIAGRWLVGEGLLGGRRGVSIDG